MGSFSGTRPELFQQAPLLWIIPHNHGETNFQASSCIWSEIGSACLLEVGLVGWMVDGSVCWSEIGSDIGSEIGSADQKVAETAFQDRM